MNQTACAVQCAALKGCTHFELNMYDQPAGSNRGVCSVFASGGYSVTTGCKDHGERPRMHCFTAAKPAWTRATLTQMASFSSEALLLPIAWVHIPKAGSTFINTLIHTVCSPPLTPFAPVPCFAIKQPALVNLTRHVHRRIAQLHPQLHTLNATRTCAILGMLRERSLFHVECAVNKSTSRIGAPLHEQCLLSHRHSSQHQSHRTVSTHRTI